MEFFRPVSFTNGAFLDEAGQPLRESPRDWGLAVQFHDLNGDGAPDLYVCNDLYTPDRLWINDGHGRFRALPALAMRHISTFSMGVDFGDLNRDGHTDFFVVDMLSPDHRRRHVQAGQAAPRRRPAGGVESRPQYRRNTLQINRGDGTFAELAWAAGVEASDWSWATIFLDVDLDGFEDILVANGHQRDAYDADIGERVAEAQRASRLSPAEVVALRGSYPPLTPPKVAYRNRGDLTFEEVGAIWGFNTPGIAHGMCLADLDNDGDMDVVMNNMNGEAGVYRNEGNRPRVAVRLNGRVPNTAGIGARITLRGGAVPEQSQEIICGGRYVSSDEPMRVFAAGSNTNHLSLEVVWRSGARSVIGQVQPNRIYEVDEAGASAALPSPLPAPPAATWFTDVSSLLQHTHEDELFNDQTRQPLLPWRLSELGPGVAWHDLDGDGHDDLIIGSGKSGTLACFRNNGRGGFARWTNGVFGQVTPRDQAGIVGLGRRLLVGSANYEEGRTGVGSVQVIEGERGASADVVPGINASAGPLALADVDADGDLDLFVGGRVVAGRFPEPAASRLFYNEGGRFVPAQTWEQMGLVSGAVFSDLDGDGFPELVVACEWGPLRILRNEQGRLNETDPSVSISAERSTFSQLRGWWHGVTTGDLDGDGRMDIVASNWGRNSPYAATKERPWKIYYGDLNGVGAVDLVEARWDPVLGKEAPQRGWREVRTALPFLQDAVGSFEAYGKAGVDDIYGDRLKSLRAAEVNTVASMVFFNRGEHWEARELPAEAQWAPAFGVCVGDLNGDGDEDIFLSQNFFGMNAEAGRHDAGRGLCLEGDGRGGLRALAGQNSGIKVYGDQRGCALNDFDGDGRVDLVVGQHGAETKLYRNASARPGLRVRLKGPAGDPRGIGAVLRLEYGLRRGPARELHAGSGYWSQDGAVQVLGRSETPTGLWVRWPGGKQTSVPLSPGVQDVELNWDERLTMMR